MSGRGRRYLALGAPRHPRAHGDHGPTREAQNDCQRQRDGTDKYDCAQMMPGNPDRLALHRARKADAERIRRVIQRQLPGRAFERNPVLIADRSREDHCMEGGLQPTQTPLIPGQSHTTRICNEIETGNQGRVRSDTSQRILPKTGGQSGLRPEASGAEVLFLKQMVNFRSSRLSERAYRVGGTPASRYFLKSDNCRFLY